MYPANCADLQPAREDAESCCKDGQTPTRPKMIQDLGTVVRQTNAGAELALGIGAPLGNLVDSHMEL